MSAMRTHADFENKFVSILDKQDPKKKKFYERMIRPRLKNDYCQV